MAYHFTQNNGQGPCKRPTTLSITNLGSPLWFLLLFPLLVTSPQLAGLLLLFEHTRHALASSVCSGFSLCWMFLCKTTAWLIFLPPLNLCPNLISSVSPLLITLMPTASVSSPPLSQAPLSWSYFLSYCSFYLLLTHYIISLFVMFISLLHSPLLPSHKSKLHEDYLFCSLLHSST